MTHSIIFAECKRGQKKDGVDHGSILHALFPDYVIKDFYKNRIYWHQFEYANGYQLLYMIHQDHLQNNLIYVHMAELAYAQR